MLTKIRFLLLILTLSLIGTAMTIHFTISDEDMLSLDEGKLTSRIHEFEDRIDGIFEDTLIVKTFQNVDNYPNQLSTISQKLAKENIYIYVYRDNQIAHWSTNIYVPVTDVGLRRTTSYLQSENRSFMVRKKDLQHGISVLALVPIKENFQTPNKLLENTFLPYFGVNDIEIAQYNDDKNIRNIYSKDQSYLFSVKLIEGKKDNIYITLQFICWVSGMICLLILVTSICVHIAKRDMPWLAVLLLFASLVLVRYIDLKSNWLSVHSSLDFFDPKYYAYNELLPNLWSYLTTTASIFWLICFLITIQHRLRLPLFVSKGYGPIVLSLVGIFSIYLIAQVMYYFLGTLLTHSPLYQHDFTKIIDLGFYGWVCIILFCFNITTIILYMDSIVQMLRYFLKDITLMLNIELICLIVSLIVITFIGFNVFFCIFFGILIFLRTYKTYNTSTPYQLSVFISTILLISSVTVIAYNHYNRIKKTETMKLAISHLLAEDDMNAVSLFIELENSINNDPRLEKLINLNAEHNETSYITDYIKTRYLSGYLSRFDFEAFFYDNEGKALQYYPVNKAAQFRENVIKSAIKIPLTNNFYRLRGELGTYEYITHISVPYEYDSEKRYHIYINLRNQSYSTLLPYPEILSDNQNPSWQLETLREHSYALYKGGSLVTQYGTYSYPEKEVATNTEVEQYTELKEHENYIHLAYKPDPYTSIVLSKQKTTLWDFLALGSIMFILLLIFFGLFNSVSYIIKTVFDKSFQWRRIRYHFRMLFNNTQYSTRIQALVILSVLLGIFISGAIAFISINHQIEETTRSNRMREISEISKQIEKHSTTVKEGLDYKMVDILKDIAPSTMTNFNLYNRSGKLLYSSQPRIFDLKLISNYINPSALNKMAILRKTEAYEQESISNFKFSSSYSILKDDEYKTMAYINIPYYTTEKDAAASKNLLLNTLLNIYTFIIILFGFIAVALSRKITQPLDIVRRKLAETQLSNKINEPLYWERNDEIGMLIKEYNYMLVKLEESAKQLRDAEREKAWREMAKQVAHEIKNPLTPMKLGIQQLVRTYNAGDPRFAERFLKVSNSFIEQIDSLSKIATEFSAFAKLPETNLTKINLVEEILKAMNLYNSSSHTTILLTNNTKGDEVFVLGDRDQILRSFNNLFKNGLEASMGRKKVRIDINLSYKDDNWIVIRIDDNGYGIPEDVIPNIFKPNFTTKSSGTGLGLAFVKQTVTGIGGKIRFITRANIGTSFIITLPRYKDTQSS